MPSRLLEARSGDGCQGRTGLKGAAGAALGGWSLVGGLLTFARGLLFNVLQCGDSENNDGLSEAESGSRLECDGC